MALYSPYDTVCSICDHDLTGGTDNVSTARFITDRAHPLYRFSDTCMHRTCFAEWEHREAFIQTYNASADRRQSHMGMDASGSIVGRSEM